VAATLKSVEIIHIGNVLVSTNYVGYHWKEIKGIYT